MKLKAPPPDTDSKRGVALIVVLGFLSIMLMMAIAFITQARVERMVADVSMDAQRGRQIARTAVNAAMSDYSYQLYAANKLMLPPKDSDFDLFLSSGRYGSGEVQPSIAGDNGTLADSGLQLMKGEARNWIPRSYLEFEDFAMDNARWMLVRRDPSKGDAADNPIVGRYAYLCFDMSGGIDANLIALSEGVANVGNATNRSSVRDVGMGELKEMEPIQGLENKPPDASLFKRLRRGWHGFDSLAELILLTNGRYNGGENTRAISYDGTDYYYIDEGVSAEELPPSKVWGPPGSKSRWREGGGWSRIERAEPALNPTNVSDLVPYSLATFRGWEYNPNTARWNSDDLMAWDEHETWGDAEWGRALGTLVDQFADKTLPDWWEKALQDYTGEDIEPQGLDYPSPKDVPMLNEVGLSVTPTIAGPSQVQFELDLEIEVWFPFPNSDREDQQYTITPRIGGNSTATLPAGIHMLIPMIIEDTNVPPNRYQVVEWDAEPNSVSDPEFTVRPGEFKRLTFTYDVQVNISMSGGATLDNAMKFRILPPKGEGFQIKTVGGGNAVDWMPAGVLDLMAVAGNILPWSTPAGPFYWEVHDPRLNHQDANAWFPASGTMGGVNDEAASYGYGVNGDSTTMFCRNGNMSSPVELGYFSTGIPWKTLEFCSKEGADVLARLATRNMIDDLEHVGVAYTNGTINPNTSSSNVLRAAFSRLKIKDNGDELEEDELDELVGIFHGITSGKKITDNSGKTEFRGACMRGVDWIWAKEFQPSGYYGTKWTKNERHRLIGSTWNLFNPNNSLFTVLAIGQSVKEGPEQTGKWSADDIITGERRAVALVWRDPTPPGLGKPHEMFIRMFKFLDE